MRVTLNIDERLVRKAREATGVKQKTTLVRMGLELLIQREAARRLAALGGTDPKASTAPRRKRPLTN
jgi:Arc/MetJ family transcription regulator